MRYTTSAHLCGSMLGNIAVTLSSPGCSLASLFRLQAPFREVPWSNEGEFDARVRACMARIKALHEHYKPLMARQTDTWGVELLCAKVGWAGQQCPKPDGAGQRRPCSSTPNAPQTSMAGLYKKLMQDQEALGICVSKDVRRHVEVGAMPACQQAAVAQWLVEASLVAAGWWRLSRSVFLSLNLLEGSCDRTITALRLTVSSVQVLSPVSVTAHFVAGDGARHGWAGIADTSC